MLAWVSELSVVGTSLTSSEEHYAFIQALSHDRPRTYHAHTPGFLAEAQMLALIKAIGAYGAARKNLPPLR